MSKAKQSATESSSSSENVTLAIHAKYAIGIDLGTTNSVLGYTSLEEDEPNVKWLPIPQLVAASTQETQSNLPSFCYLANEHEASTGSYDLPWAQDRNYVVGEMARKQAADVPMRTVCAAKSWLCHSRVDRHADILPWNAMGNETGNADDVKRISPVEATKRYLEHLIAAWEASFPDAPIVDQQVVLTVPASFDASARELTREAALAAGLPEHLILLEEPQAAVYAWLVDYGDRWRKLLKVGDTLLVCDVGGGTTDFSLIQVAEEQGSLILQRKAVGQHLLVGGDNMDLALAHHVAGEFAQKNIKLDPWQSVSLWHSCRTAKETLLSSDGPETHPISVLGRGSRLIGGTVSVDVQSETASQLLLEGFLPECKLSDQPTKRHVSGFQEIGLPFESETAITKHLAAFLNAHGEEGKAVRPTHVLFNGGVFKATMLRERLLNVVGSWFGGKSSPEGLECNQDLDNAVAKGAAYYGFTKQGKGIRIRGGTPRAYYVGIETAGLAIPGAPRPMQALCVVPIGMEEGTEADVPSSEIGLVVGAEAQFRFFSSAIRKDDTPGTKLPQWEEGELNETAPLKAMFKMKKGNEEEYVPVKFQSKITELGLFELWCVSVNSDDRWKLEFSVRED